MRSETDVKEMDAISKPAKSASQNRVYEIPASSRSEEALLLGRPVEGMTSSVAFSWNGGRSSTVLFVWPGEGDALGDGLG